MPKYISKSNSAIYQSRIMNLNFRAQGISKTSKYLHLYTMIIIRLLSQNLFFWFLYIDPTSDIWGKKKKLNCVSNDVSLAFTDNISNRNFKTSISKFYFNGYNVS